MIRTQDEHNSFMIQLESRRDESAIEMQRIANKPIPLEEGERRAVAENKSRLYARRKSLVEELLLLEETIRQVELQSQE